MDVDGKLFGHDDRLAREHLDACWKCRARRQELRQAIAGFVRLHQGEWDAKFPPADGPRALLKAQLAQLSAVESAPRSQWLAFRRFVWALGAAACGVLALGFFLRDCTCPFPALFSKALIVSVPDSRLTPGATLRLSRIKVCSEASTNNKVVPVALQRKVFEECRMVGAEPRAYEVDYLVTPALGGADDIHNLWPHSYSATVWNAQVKDALENRLRTLVCSGQLDLATAQRDISEDWVAAYKKYFHTDSPIKARDDR